MAAGVQSGIGLVESGSTFAVLQSAGMAGISTESSLGLALGGAGIVGIIDGIGDDEEDMDYIQVLKEKFKNFQHFVVEEIDELDIDSIKAQYHDIIDYMDSVIDMDELRDSVKSGYDTVKK